jgi:hypothetical protein
VLALVVALGACSHQRKIPDSYGDTTRDNFIEGCEESLTQPEGEGEVFSDEDATAVCRCSYEAISDPDEGIPYEDFKTFNEDLEDDPGPLPDELRDRIDACSSEAGLS